MKNNVTPKKRFMLLLDDADKASIRKTEKEFSTKITSSQNSVPTYDHKTFMKRGMVYFLKILAS